MLMPDLMVVEERRRELMRQAEAGRLARAGRRSRKAGRSSEKGDVKVRWGLHADDAAVADLFELNGMPRWAAFEDRFLVAEDDGRVVGAVRYRTESKRLVLELLVADPWVDEAGISTSLYGGAAALARELCATSVWATDDRFAEHARRAGYRGRRGHLHLEVGPRRERRGLLDLIGTSAVPFFRPFRG